MSQREWKPHRLDVEAFARQRGHLQGHWPLASFQRLIESAHPEALPQPSDSVEWSATGQTQPTRGGGDEIWLKLVAHARVNLVCQRCLGSIPAQLDVDRQLRFVNGEEAAADLDAESEDDVLALTRSLNLQDLVEDELLLALPLVPRHDDCAIAAPPGGDDPRDEAPKRQPFAALAALKRGSSGS